MYRLSGTSALATGESNRFPVRDRRFLGDNKAERFPASMPLEIRHGDNPIGEMAIDLYQAQVRPMTSSAAKALSLRSQDHPHLERAILAATVPPPPGKVGATLSSSFRFYQQRVRATGAQGSQAVLIIAGFGPDRCCLRPDR